MNIEHPTPKKNNSPNKYDIILVIGELFFDHPMSGPGILKRLLEKYGYSVGIIEQPQKIEDIKILGKPNLFFGITSGSIDSMIRNYTPLKKRRDEDENLDYDEKVKDRAVIVYSSWIKEAFKDSIIVLGGSEATLRRFVHFDYWDNKIRKPILFDAKANILVYGNGEKQILEIAKRLKENIDDDLNNINGTSIIIKENQIPKNAVLLPSFDELNIDKKTNFEINQAKEKFVDMQNLFSNKKLLAQKIDNRFILQYPSPIYTSKDLDEYYELPFTRKVPKMLRGFEFSVVTHRGCIGNCNFCSLRLISGNKIISRSEESILREIKNITQYPYFKGNIDDLGGPSVNMYGMDCDKKDICEKNCIDCKLLDRSQKKLISLLKKANKIDGVKHIYIRSGIRYDLANEEYVTQLIEGNHIYDTLRIAPEHINKNVLNLMNKNKGDLNKFIKMFNDIIKKNQDIFKNKKELSFYFMTAHPGSTMMDAEELANFIKNNNLKNSESVQIFIPTPMTNSTCMYYTSLDLNKKKIYVPYTYKEKKEQKRILF
jgi:uncharacterized radical SAM protein YgiQ